MTDEIRILLDTAPIRAWGSIALAITLVLLGALYIVSLSAIKPIASFVASLEIERTYCGRADDLEAPKRIHNHIDHAVHLLLARRHEPETFGWIGSLQDLIESQRTETGSNFTEMQSKLLRRTLGKATENLLNKMDRFEDRVRLVRAIKTAADEHSAKAREIEAAQAKRTLTIEESDGVELHRAGSTMIVVRGSGFEHGLSIVLFNNKTCRSTAPNSKQLLVEIPADVTAELAVGDEVEIFCQGDGVDAEGTVKIQEIHGFDLARHFGVQFFEENALLVPQFQPSDHTANFVEIEEATRLQAHSVSLLTVKPPESGETD